MDYNKLLQAILDIAEEMLVCGAEVSRVEESIERMCGAYGCDRRRVKRFHHHLQHPGNAGRPRGAYNNADHSRALRTIPTLTALTT